MYLFSALFLLKFLEAVGAHRQNIDINRLKLLTAETHFDHYLAAPIESKNVGPMESEHKTPLKTYQPREDPRLFYQSDAYTKYNSEDKVNKEVTAIYPGQDVIRANERHYSGRIDRMRKRGQSFALKDNGNCGDCCIRCPHDRTLIAKGGSNKVLLQTPRLSSCFGRPVPRNVHFVHMYGPRFGTLLDKGTHTIVGRITHGNTTLQHCKLQIDVLLQACHTPKYLESQCGERHMKCNFTCRDKGLQLQGQSSLLCGEDLKWSGPLPACKAPSCAPIPPPPESHVSCQGSTVGRGNALVDGSRCRVRCPRGWRSNTRGAAALCRKGVWTKTLACLPKRNLAMKRS